MGHEAKVTMTYISRSSDFALCLEDYLMCEQRFYLISWKLFAAWTSYFGIMSQYDLLLDIKITVGHCDLYFMIQWFCFISWRLFDVWTEILPYILKTICCMNIILWDYESYFWIMSQYDLTFDLKINVGDCDIFHGPVILPYILNTIWYMNTILWDYESVWPDVWPKNKCRSLWHIFHGLVILPYILKTIQ